MTQNRRLAPSLLAFSLLLVLSPAQGQEFGDEAARARAAFETAFIDECDWALGGSPDMREPEVFEMSYKASWAGEDEPHRQVRVYRFFCTQGAYNSGHVFLIGGDDGIETAQFAVPDVQIDYARNADGSVDDARVTGMRLVGFAARARLVNSEVDAAAGEIHSVGYWRGIGDAADTGSWRLMDGHFVLTDFTVDGSYDGEITPVQVVEDGQTVLR